MQGARSAEKERQWNFPPESRGVPRGSEPAVRQPSPSASESHPDATGVPSKQFHFFAASSRLIKASRGGLRGTFHSCTNHVKGQIVIYHSCTNHVKGQVVMRFIVTGVYGDHALSTCREIKRANQKFCQTTYATPLSLPPGTILALNRKASPSFLRFPI